MMMAVGNLYAWGPIGHYAIARECGVSHDKAGLYNLPDAWDSWAFIVVNLNDPNANFFEITDYFCWSHAVARNPKEWSFYGIIPLRVPSIPEYHLEHEPGHIIKVFINEDKVEQWQTVNGNIPAEKTKAEDTARFFTGHNAADYHVHWSYFGGGSVDGWMTGHKTKEEWADYAILICRQQITFKANGDIATFWGNTVTLAVLPMPLSLDKVNLLAIRLAQLAARKNRFILDQEDFSPGISNPNVFNGVETINSLRSRISDLEEDINERISEFSLDKWLELKEVALENSWMSITYDSISGQAIEDFSQLLQKLNLAKNRFQSLVP